MGQGAYILGCQGAHLSSSEAVFFQQADPWGFILFARNVQNPDQLGALTSELRSAVGRDAPILIDQEGGRVQRMTSPHWRQWLPPLDHILAAGKNAERSMWLRYRLIADELRAVGIDANCAPTLDIANAQTHVFLRNRCYGENSDTVLRIGRAVADGLTAGGILPVMKHMPGHGRARVDSHAELPRVAESADTLFAQDFAPFCGLCDLPIAMTAHIVFESIAAQPATTSPELIRLIRDGIGFKGVLMTDDISMQALGGTVGQRASASLKAGCDMVLHCNGDLKEMDKIAEVSQHMDAASQRRADEALTTRKQADPIDIDALEEEIRLLMNGKVYG